MRARLLPDIVSEAALRQPAGLAVVDGHRRLSWADLDVRVADCAWLLAEAGVDRGDRVAVLSAPSADLVVLVHAARAAGVVLVPLAPRGTTAETAWQVAHAAPRLLLHDSDRATLAAMALDAIDDARLPPALDLGVLAGSDGPEAGTHAGGPAPESSPRGSRSLEASQRAGPAPEASPLPPFDPAVPATILFTSGTTGRPKAAILTWANHLASARAWASVLEPRPGDRWLLALPTHHVAGIGTIVRAAVAGSAVVCAGEGFDAGHVVDLVERERITHLSVVATTLERLLDALEAPARAVASLRAVLLGGGPWPPDLALRALAAGLPIVTTYGMTETASGVAAAPADLVASHPGASGRALAGVDLAVEADGRPAAPGEVGEIVVSGPMVFAGYLGDPEATEAVLRDGRLRTGDLGSLDAEGILTVVDRRDDLIVSGGENVYPAEVEAVLRSHPDVVDAAVVGMADPAWGAVPVALVVLRGGAGADPAALRAHARERLAAYKVPARVVPVAAIRRTASGKIVRRDLRALLDDGGAPEARPPDPSGPPASGSSAAPARHTRTLARDGADVAYGVTGSGPGVVLLHATLSRGRAWIPIERRIATRATVVSIDRRGHRASPDPDPMRLTAADHVADVAAIVERERVAPALVVGHSFGGCVALELAVRHPEIVAGVVAYEPPYLALAPDRVRRAMSRVASATAAAHAAGDGPLAAETFLRAVLGDAGFRALPAGVRASVLREGDAAASDSRLVGFDPAGLSRIRVPVTIVVGDDTSRLYRTVADAIAAAVPSARVVSVPGADHMAPVSRPESVVPIIEAALDAVFTR